jgi:hypothetical protein
VLSCRLTLSVELFCQSLLRQQTIQGGIRKCVSVHLLVVRVLGYRSGGPGSIPGTTKKKVVGLERGALSLVSTTEELLDRKVAAPVAKVGSNFAGKQRLLGRYSSLADSDHGV